MVRLFITILLCVALPATCFAENKYPLIRETRDATLQGHLNGVVQSLGLNRAVKKRKLSIALVDITNESFPLFAGVNGDHMMYAASLPKIAILFGLFKRLEQGSMEWDEPTKRLANEMIRVSSNSAATTLFKRVGPNYILKLLQQPEYRLYEKRRGGGIWVGKEYGKGRAIKRDPLYNLSHGATAIKVARFFYLLETGRLVSSPWDERMKEVFSDPAINHKFVKGLSQVCPQADVYRKSGSWRSFHADAAIVEHDDRKYIAVALANDPNGGKWFSKIIVELDRLVFLRGAEPWTCDELLLTPTEHGAAR